MTNEENLALQLWRTLEPDRDAWSEHVRERLAELGAEAHLSRFDGNAAEWGDSPWTHHGSPVAGMVQELAGQVKNGMAALGAEPARLSTVYVTTTLQHDVSAQLQPFPDGSGLVTIADSVFGLISPLARHAAAALDRLNSRPAPARIARSYWAAARGSLAEDPDLLFALLRYYTVNQRVFGLAANLVRPLTTRAENIALLISHFAFQFVIGHEIAHHVLAHGSAPGGAQPSGGHLPVCSEDQRRELEADLLAHRAVLAEARAGGSVAHPSVLALLGAFVAMVAIHLSERGLFLRYGFTHPTAASRAERLYGEADPQARLVTRLFTNALLPAVESAATFAPGATVFDADRYAGSPLIDTPQPSQYLHTIAGCDRLLCRPPGFLMTKLGEVADVTGLPALRAGVAAIDSGDTGGALRSWGVRPDVTAGLLDAAQPLTFHTVLEEIRKGLLRQGLPAEHGRLSAIVAAKLVEFNIADPRQ
ncbi:MULTISPECIES: hypothetical protein [Amycolatopsis]|uniref:hypothetical protein n=1 Tax=Amycolatopsis TaxID=1813 RepID=UPI0031F87804